MSASSSKPSALAPGPIAISHEQRKSFARDGAICVHGVLDSPWLNRLSKLFEQPKRQGRDLSGYYGDEIAATGVRSRADHRRRRLLVS